MNSDLDFTIIKNGLYREAEIKLIKIKNLYYEISVFYFGDYGTDKSENRLSIDNIYVICKTCGDAFDIQYLKGQIFVNIASMPLVFTINEMDKLKSMVEVSEQSALRFHSFMEEYFPIIIQDK